jgi:hypothetical protein
MAPQKIQKSPSNGKGGRTRQDKKTEKNPNPPCDLVSTSYKKKSSKPNTAKIARFPVQKKRVTKLATAESKVKILAAQVRLLRREKKATIATIGELQTQLEQTKKALAKRDAEIERLRTDLVAEIETVRAEGAHERAQLVKSSADLVSQVVRLNKIISDSSVERIEERRRVTELTHEVKELKKENLKEDSKAEEEKRLEKEREIEREEQKEVRTNIHACKSTLNDTSLKFFTIYCALPVFKEKFNSTTGEYFDAISLGIICALAIARNCRTLYELTGYTHKMSLRASLVTRPIVSNHFEFVYHVASWVGLIFLIPHIGSDRFIQPISMFPIGLIILAWRFKPVFGQFKTA